MASLVYDNGLDLLGGGTGAADSTWELSEFRMLLVNPSYTPNRATHVNVSDITHELSGGGYSRPTITTPTRTVNNTTHEIEYGCDNPSFGSITAGQTAQAGVLFMFITNDSQSLLIAYIDFAGVPTNGTPFIYTVPAAGVLHNIQP